MRVYVYTHTQTVSERQTALSWLLELWSLMLLAHLRPYYSAHALVRRLHGRPGDMSVRASIFGRTCFEQQQTPRNCFKSLNICGHWCDSPLLHHPRLFAFWCLQSFQNRWDKVLSFPVRASNFAPVCINQ